MHSCAVNLGLLGGHVARQICRQRVVEQAVLLGHPPMRRRRLTSCLGAKGCCPMQTVLWGTNLQEPP